MAPSMDGKSVLVTGANSGIGLATARALAAMGGEILMVCRDPSRGEAARVSVAQGATGRPPTVLIADLGSQSAIRRLADTVSARGSLDVLVNNAGGLFAPRTLADGIERTFAVNHLAPFLLTALLRPALAAAPSGRVVTVSSGIHAASLAFDDLEGERRYSAMRAYAASKLCNVLFSNALARRLAGSTVTSNALEPGFVATNFGGGSGLFGIAVSLAMRTPLAVSPEKGARTSIWLASSPDVAGMSGGYFARCRLARTRAIANDVAVQERLWAVSEALAGLPPEPAPSAR